MLLTVDANILGFKRPLASNAVTRMLDEARGGLINAFVSDVVVRETVNGWMESVQEWERKRQEACHALSERGVFDLGAADPPLDLLRLRVRVDEQIRSRLEDADVRISPLPELGHQAVVERALARRQPFDRRGHDGYRDVLLWESILEMAREETIFFVTRDRARSTKDASLERSCLTI